MAKNLQIQLEFTTKGAKELIDSLKILAKEQNKVSAAQRKFNNANLKAVTATKKLLMAQEKHRFAMLKTSTQIAKLKEQVRVLRMRNKQLAVSTTRVTKAQNRMRISTSGLQRIIGSIRNKILLVTFAFGGMAAGIRSSVQTAMQFEAVQVRLKLLCLALCEAGEQAFRTFNQVAATTPFTLTDVVEAGAALKAFGTNAEEMIKPTADLAAFMGANCNRSSDKHLVEHLLVVLEQQTYFVKEVYCNLFVIQRESKIYLQ
jgi:phage tail tape-measure protein